MKINILIVLIIILIPLLSPAQKIVRDSAMNRHLIYPTYGFDLPAGDMADRFGASHQVGAGYMFKAKSGWSIGVEANFIFRDGVKNSLGVLKSSFSSIVTSDGFVIDENGTFSNVMVTERGYTIWAKVGKIWPVVGPNPNSGLMAQLGLGMLQHKYRIDVTQNSAPQLRGDYKKGYDKMCNGPAMSEFFGYQNMSNNGKYNFYGGFEFIQAFTFSRRSYYFVDHKKPDEKRFDMLNGVKVGWYIPVSRKANKRFFYY